MRRAAFSRSQWQDISRERNRNKQRSPTLAHLPDPQVYSKQSDKAMGRMKDVLAEEWPGGFERKGPWAGNPDLKTRKSYIDQMQWVYFSWIKIQIC